MRINIANGGNAERPEASLTDCCVKIAHFHAGVRKVCPTHLQIFSQHFEGIDEDEDDDY